MGDCEVRTLLAPHRRGSRPASRHQQQASAGQPSCIVAIVCRWIRQESKETLGKFLFQIIEATRGGMPSRDGNRSPRDDGSWGSRAKDFVICAEAALRGKKSIPYPLNNSSLGRWVG
eukprot:SAG25_NODE_15_length_24441_cov_175.207288_12_plen_117_part_00